MKIFAGLLIILACSGVAAETKTYWSQLTGWLGKADPINDGAMGSALLTFDTATSYLSVNMSYSTTGLSDNTITAHVHVGAVGIDGSAIITLTQTSGIVGTTINYMAGGGTLNAAQITALDSAGLYINLHTATTPAGELRGQIIPTTNYYSSYLDGFTARTASVATGTGYCTIDNASTGQVTCKASWVNMTATSVHVRGPAYFTIPASTASSLITLTISDNSASGTGILNAVQMEYLRRGLLYFNVNSTTYGSGEIRGQIFMVNTNITDFLNGVFTSTCRQTTNGWETSCSTITNGMFDTKFITYNSSTCSPYNIVSAGAYSGFISYAFASPSRLNYDATASVITRFTAITRNATQFPCRTGFLLSDRITILNRIDCASAFTPNYYVTQPDNAARTARVTQVYADKEVGWYNDFNTNGMISSSTGTCPDYIQQYLFPSYYSSSSTGSNPSPAYSIVPAFTLLALLMTFAFIF